VRSPHCTIQFERQLCPLHFIRGAQKNRSWHVGKIVEEHNCELDETKELAHHQHIATTSDLYGGMSLDAKRKAQSCLVKHVRQEAKKRP
jgi:hypothetical protein